MQLENQCPAIGRLMAPDEVYEATRGSKLPEALKRQWFLCGDIPEKIWDLLANPEPLPKSTLGFRVTAFTTPSNCAFVAFTIQLDASQVRIIVPMGTAKTEEFLRAACDSGVNFSLGRNNSNMAVVRGFAVESVHLKPLLALAKNCRPIDVAETIVEFALAIAEARRPGLMPSALPGVELDDVHVIAILPEHINADETATLH